MDAGKGGIIFFNFQDVTDKGDICQMVTQSAIELKKKRSWKRQEEQWGAWHTKKMGETSKQDIENEKIHWLKLFWSLKSRDVSSYTCPQNMTMKRISSI